MPARDTQDAARQRFADAAWRLGCSGGYEAVTMRAIAQDLGVSGALIYSYFEDKAALMDELRRVSATQLHQRLADVADGGQPGMLRICRVYVEYVREHKWLYEGGSKLELVGPASPHAQAFVARAARLVVDAAGGDFDDASAVAVHLWLALQGVVSLPRDARFDRRFTEDHLTIIVRGVVPALAGLTGA